MDNLNISELKYKSIDPVIYEIFPESWEKRREFTLYKSNPRPCSALFFVFSDTEVRFFCGSSHVTAKKGDVVFIPGGICYHVKIMDNSKSDIGTYTLNFDLYGEDNSIVSIYDTVTVLTNRQDSLYVSRLRALSETVHRIEDGSYNKLKVKGEFLLLLNSIVDAVTSDSDSYYPIRRGIDLFCEEWNKNEKIEKYAELCGISDTYFYRCFRKWAGVSPVEYRNSLRLSNAENLLKCTDMRIQEISEAVGYDDPFYFCRIFKSKYGISPQKYRKSIRK